MLVGSGSIAGMDKILADAILFDLDGTLVDSFELSMRWWQDWADQTGLDSDSVIRYVRGLSVREALRDLMPDRPAELNDADAVSLGRWWETNAHLMRAAAGAARLLSDLKPDRWAVVTTSNQSQATARLPAAGLPVPNVLVTADDVRNVKPDPEGYLLASAALGMKPADCVVVEDSPTGVRAGLSAGATVLAIGEGAAADVETDVVQIQGLRHIQVTQREATVELHIKTGPGNPRRLVLVRLCCLTSIFRDLG
jgi:sugar-phosphatase